jgi:hypothetical protein
LILLLMAVALVAAVDAALLMLLLQHLNLAFVMHFSEIVSASTSTRDCNLLRNSASMRPLTSTC